MRVLVIEDDAIFARSIEMMLKSEGHVCDYAATGEDGVRLGNLHNFDVVILDLMLPDMEGYEVVRRLRADMVAAPILILSGLSELDSKIKGLTVGADDYLTKPFDRDELIVRVQALVRRSMGNCIVPDLEPSSNLLLAKKGAAAPWSFNMSYTPYGQEVGGPDAGDGGADARAHAPPPRPRRVIKFPSRDGLVEDLAAEHDLDAQESEADGGQTKVAEAAPRTQPTSPALKTPPRAQTPAAAPPSRSRPENAEPIVVLGDEQGGTGKSSAAMRLVVAFMRDGHAVASVDLDARKDIFTRYLENLRAFTEEPGLDQPLLERHAGDLSDASPEDLEEILKDYVATHDFVVIDTPGGENALSNVAGELANKPKAPAKHKTAKQSAAKRKAAAKHETARKSTAKRKIATKHETARKSTPKPKAPAKQKTAKQSAAKRKAAAKHKNAKKTMAKREPATRAPARGRKRSYRQ